MSLRDRIKNIIEKVKKGLDWFVGYHTEQEVDSTLDMKSVILAGVNSWELTKEQAVEMMQAYEGTKTKASKLKERIDVSNEVTSGYVDKAETPRTDHSKETRESRDDGRSLDD